MVALSFLRLTALAIGFEVAALLNSWCCEITRDLQGVVVMSGIRRSESDRRAREVTDLKPEVSILLEQCLA